MTGDPPPSSPHDPGAEHALRVERRWASVAVLIVIFLIVMAAVAGVHQATMPQLKLELVDPRTLHVSGEFIESNLGTAVEPDGSVTVRAIGQQYSFVPQCIVVPTDTVVHFRATSGDVVHGFLIDGTNLNTMLIPGFISTATARFSTPIESHMPCHEYCGVGHEGMWGKVKVIDKAAFEKLAADRRRLTCVD
jgi:cytochrome c oxidase subunit 2